MAWDERAITTDNRAFQGQGNPGSGDDFHAAPNLDHSQEFVREDLKEWLGWLTDEVGFDSVRFDFTKGYAGNYVGEYVEVGAVPSGILVVLDRPPDGGEEEARR